MNSLRFSIRFHTAFRVGTGLAGHGMDDTVDAAAPLPASSLKGVMRASAGQILARCPDLIDAVFGTPSGPSPWSWSSATFDGGTTTVGSRARTAVDPDTHTVRPGALFRTEHVEEKIATFDIDLMEPLDDETLQDHMTVLIAAAQGVHALGADRRRGLGWVGIEATQPTFDEAAQRRLLELREGAR